MLIPKFNVHLVAFSGYSCREHLYEKIETSMWKDILAISQDVFWHLNYPGTTWMSYS